MEQAVIKVFVSPTNDSSLFLESVSTQSNGHAEIICEKETDDHDEEEKYDEILKDSGMLENDGDRVEDDVSMATETARKEKTSSNMENGTKSTSAPLANVARTLHVARSWLNRSRASNAKRKPRVDSFLEKLEMAGPSHVTHGNNHEFDAAYSTRIVGPCTVRPLNNFNFYSKFNNRKS